MNALAIKVGLRTIANRVIFFAKRNAPQIMVGAGIVGFVGTAVATGSAAVKAKDILDIKDASLENLREDIQNGVKTEEQGKYEEKVIKKSAAFGITSAFIKPVIFGAASTALVLGGHGILGKRAARFAAEAYAAETKLHKYRGNVIRQLGSDIDQKIFEGLPVDQKDILDRLRIKSEDEKKKLAAPDEEYARIKCAENSRDEGREFLFAMETCSTWRQDAESNKAFLRRAQAQAMDMLRERGILFINDILIYILGAERGTSYGATHGWIYYKTSDGEEPVIDFGLLDIDGDMQKRLFLEGVEPNVWLTFNCLERDISGDIDVVERQRNFKRWPNTRPAYN